MTEADKSLEHYVIHGGRAGKKRLDLLASVTRDSTRALLQEAGLGAGARLLDLGCGGGHVSFEVARMVGRQGGVTGLDLDATKLELAREEATRLGLTNVRFLQGNALDMIEAGSQDFTYARFLLTHLPDPLAVLGVMREALKPGGVAIVEDIDMSGAFCYPENEAFSRAAELYRQVVRRRGGDPDIGPRLPGLLREADFESIHVNLVQPLHLAGEHKKLMLVTFQNITESLLAEDLADPAEIDRTIAGLSDFSEDPTTLVALPRIVQSWGTSPG